MKKKLCSILLFCNVCALVSQGQIEGFHFKASIDSINVAGFYNILITPEISSHLKTDFSDLRIINGSGKWIPHLIRFPGGEQTNHNVLWDLQILKNENNLSFSEIIVKSFNAEISNLKIELRNTEVERFCTLTGSDDSTHWFIINDSILIKPAKSESDSLSLFDILFPPNNYKFYKLLINNSGKSPYNIRRVITSSAYTDPNTSQSLLSALQNPAAVIIQKDSGKLSYIKVIQQAPFRTDKIELKVSGAKYFYRTVELFLPNSINKKGNYPGQLIQTFTISNNSTLQFNINPLSDSVFYLVIYNEDNLPLKVDEVKTYSNLFLATVYLEKGNGYSIVMGNLAANAPNYDLQRINLNLNQPIPPIGTGIVAPIPQANKKLSQNDNKTLVWSIIIIAALVLGFFTFKLATEMNKNKA